MTCDYIFDRRLVSRSFIYLFFPHVGQHAHALRSLLYVYSSTFYHHTYEYTKYAFRLCLLISLPLFTGLRSSFAPGVTLGTALGVMIGWRAYAKVIGLLGWWRAGRELTKSPNEDDDWAFLYAALAGSAALATAAAAAGLHHSTS